MRQRRFISFYLILFSFLATIAGYSQADKETQRALSNLGKLEGIWEGNLNYKMNGKEYKLYFKMSFTPVPGGKGFYMNELTTNPELGETKGGNLIGYDPYSRSVQWFSVDNNYTCHVHTGNWVTDDHLNLYHSSIRNGLKYEEKIDMTWKDKDHFYTTFNSYLDGVLKEEGEGTMTRLTAEE